MSVIYALSLAMRFVLYCYIFISHLIITASLAEVNVITRSRQIINPKMPNNLRPKNIAINVASGDRPICCSINLGSTVLLIASNIIARVVLPAKNTYKAQGANIAIDPMIGTKSIIQMINDIITATSGEIMSRPIKDTIKIIVLTNNCVFKKPNRTFESLLPIKATLLAVSTSN